MPNAEPQERSPGFFARVAGGSASRAELYGIVGAVFVLTVGGVSGAAVVISGQGRQSSHSTSTTTTIAVAEGSSGSTTTGVPSTNSAGRDRYQGIM